MPRPWEPPTRSAGAVRVLPLILAVALCGCGSKRMHGPDAATPLAPQGSHPAFFPFSGVNFSVPLNWHVFAGTAPLVATITSGEAMIAVWRYPRSEPLPSSRGSLRAARTSLLAAARARDATLRVIASRTLRVGRAPAVQIIADETISGHPRRVRSTHVYSHGAEFVLDQYAPNAEFGILDVTVFAPMVASTHLTRVRVR